MEISKAMLTLECPHTNQHTNRHTGQNTCRRIPASNNRNRPEGSRMFEYSPTVGAPVISMFSMILWPFNVIQWRPEDVKKTFHPDVLRTSSCNFQDVLRTSSGRHFVCWDISPLFKKAKLFKLHELYELHVSTAHNYIWTLALGYTKRIQYTKV